MRRRLNTPVTAYHLLIHLFVCLSVAGATLFVALMVNGRSDRKFCEVADKAIHQAELQADGLDQSPPTTPAGVAIRDGWRESVQSYRNLKRDLGCQEAKP